MVSNFSTIATRRRRRNQLWLMTALVAFVAPPSARGQDDCNDNGLPDELDIEQLERPRTAARFPCAPDPRGSAVGDFNGDGRADLAVTDYPDSRWGFVVVLINRGNRTFHPGVAYQTFGPPHDVEAGDLDGNGTVDLIVANRVGNDDEGSIAVLLGAGNGTFSPPRRYEAEEPGDGDIRSLVLSDLDGDGALDVAHTNSSRYITVWRNLGDGSLGDWIAIDALHHSNHLTAHDLDGNGYAELLVANRGLFTVLWNRGAFQFDVSSHPSERVVDSIAVVDLDDNRLPDLALAHPWTRDHAPQVSLWATLAGREFEQVETIEFGDGVRSIRSADLNGDHRRDLVISSEFSDTVKILFRRGEGQGAGSSKFENVVRIGDGGAVAQMNRRTGKDVAFVTVADVDGDRRDDIVVSNQRTRGEEQGHVTILFNEGRGAFRSLGAFETLFDRVPSGFAPGRLPAVAADFNGDQVPDVAVSSSLLLRRGDGGFGPAESVGPPGGAVDAADVDRDGDVDLVFLRGETVATLRNDGHAGFSTVETPSGGFAGWSLRLLDFNGDGWLDALFVATDARNRSRVAVALNEGAGAFLGGQFISEDIPLGAAAYSDLDGDGDADLATVYGSSAGFLSVHRNEDGRYRDAAKTFPAPGRPSTIDAADLDGDGDMDLVAGGEGEHPDYHGGIFVYLNRGDRSFGEPVVYAQTVGTTCVLPVDIDRDGDVDLVASHPRGKDIVMLRNQGDGIFFPPEYYRGGSWPESIVAADFNGDGIRDLAASNPESGLLTVLLLESRATSADCNANGVPDECDIREGRLSDRNGNLTADRCEGVFFRRGDVDGSGRTELNDGIATLNYLFLAGQRPPCLDAADVDDDGVLNVTDPVRLFGFLFIGWLPPSPPFGECDVDPTADELDCEEFAPCT